MQKKIGFGLSLIIIAVLSVGTVYAVDTFGHYYTSSQLASSTPLTVGGQYPMQLDAQQNLEVAVENSSSTPANVAIVTTTTTPVYVQEVFGYSYLSTLATTTLKASSGVLHELNIYPLGGPTSTITLYDVGTSTFVVTSTPKIALYTITTSTQPISARFDIFFANGLTITETGATTSLTAAYQ